MKKALFLARELSTAPLFGGRLLPTEGERISRTYDCTRSAFGGEYGGIGAELFEDTDIQS